MLCASHKSTASVIFIAKDFSSAVSFVRLAKRTKHDAPMPISTSTTTIKGQNRNCRHRITSAMPWPSRRAAGGLRRPSESRALLAFPRTLYQSVGPAPTTNVSFKMRNSMIVMQCQTEDLKTSALLTGIRGMGPSNSRRRRFALETNSAVKVSFFRR